MESRGEALDQISQMAVDALLEEARLSPKPGLVDAFDCGSHQDMDITLLVKSSLSFRKGFYDYLSCGFKHRGSKPALFEKIRQVGVANESNMFMATGQVNTHKGANFSFGLILGALGFFLSDRKGEWQGLSFKELQTLFDIVKGMTKDLVQKDFKDLHLKTQLSYGEKLYLKYGFAGIRQEAEAGYPTLTALALPRLLELKNRKKPREEIYTEMLFTIMTVAEDSNIISRGGFDSLTYVKKAAEAFLEAGGTDQPNYKGIINTMNRDFKAKNLSPGGSADLLALTIFMDKLMDVS